MTETEILADYEYLESQDIKAVLLYASNIANAKTVVPTLAKAA